MTRKELNIAIFEGTAKGVLWQPRLETFWSLNYNLGTTEWEELFLKSYGMDNIDYSKIKFYLTMSQRDF